MKYVLAVSLSINALLLTSSCGQKVARPDFNPLIYPGDSSTASMYRAQSGDRISCSNERIDEGAWMSYRDIGCLYDVYIDNCKVFKDPKRICNEIDADVVKAVILSQ